MGEAMAKAGMLLFGTNISTKFFNEINANYSLFACHAEKYDLCASCCGSDVPIKLLKLKYSSYE